MDVNSCLVFMGFKYFYLDKYPNILVAAQNGCFFFASTTNTFWKRTSLAFFYFPDKVFAPCFSLAETLLLPNILNSAIFI